MVSIRILWGNLRGAETAAVAVQIRCERDDIALNGGPLAVQPQRKQPD